MSARVACRPTTNQTDSSTRSRTSITNHRVFSKTWRTPAQNGSRLSTPSRNGCSLPPQPSKAPLSSSLPVHVLGHAQGLPSASSHRSSASTGRFTFRCGLRMVSSRKEQHLLTEGRTAGTCLFPNLRHQTPLHRGCAVPAAQARSFAILTHGSKQAARQSRRLLVFHWLYRLF